MPKRLDPDIHHTTAQPTFNGRNAMVVIELAQARGITQAEVVAWIVDQWIDGPGLKHLLEVHKIDVRNYRAPNRVVSITRKKKGRQE